jgi:hypothetical protein
MKSSRVVSPRNAENTWLRSRLAPSARHMVEPLERDFRAFHLPDQCRVGERIRNEKAPRSTRFVWR